MTFIQPHKNSSAWNFVLGFFVLLLLLGTGSLVALYNHVVDLNHEIAATNASLDSVGAENTALNNQVIAALGTDQGAGFAETQGLVLDSKPQYFTEPPSQSVAVK